MINFNFNNILRPGFWFEVILIFFFSINFKVKYANESFSLPFLIFPSFKNLKKDNISKNFIRAKKMNHSQDHKFRKLKILRSF